jgi:hypothetical protein
LLGAARACTILPVPFPVSVRGAFVVPSDPGGVAAVDQAVARIAGRLREHPLARVRTAPGTIDFTRRISPLRPECGWDLLTPIARGRVGVQRSETGIRIAYEIRLSRALLVTATMMVGSGWFLTSAGMPWAAAAALAAFSWTVMFVPYFVSSAIRFPRFLRAALRESSAGRTGS